MDEAKSTEIAQWIIKADHDLKSAKRLIEGDQPLADTAVFHCQQAAEKALKAYLAFNDVPVQRTHILGVLVEQCMVFDESFRDLSEAADILTPFAIVFRYPGDVSEPEMSDVNEARQLAQEIFDFVLARMPGEVRKLTLYQIS